MGGMNSHFDIINHVEYVNLKSYLSTSYNEYQYYIVENGLDKISSREKKQLGIHFILRQIFFICSESKHKKCFYYQRAIDTESEYKLIKLIFNSLPARLIVDDQTFNTFVKEDCMYYPYVPIDTSKISWKKFKSLLKRQNLTSLERTFTENNSVKLSLIH
ncbi:hypothetical protein N9273_00070 [bacterium]|nr:hypothetical protein [bacterium]